MVTRILAYNCSYHPMSMCAALLLVARLFHTTVLYQNTRNLGLLIFLYVLAHM
jgi:hypothetical protein